MPDAYEILQRMVQAGYYSECLQAIEELRSDLFDASQIVSNRRELNALLQTMRRAGLDLTVLRDINHGKFWEMEIRAKLAKRDTLRTWELIRKSRGGKSQNERIPLPLLKSLVSELYDLMIRKKQLQDVDLTQNPPPTRVYYAVRERSPAKFDRLRRLRKPRAYQLRGRAPGLDLANEFTAYAHQVSLKILAIAAYFSEKKRRR
jgi:hypothetical protein